MPSISMFRRARTPAPGHTRVGIIDIGSNSIRLVIYDGPARIPAALFNEKVMAGLGKGVSRDGMLDADSVERALSTLARFRRLSEQMGVPQPRTVATAAVREASNGQQFIDRVLDLGLPVEILSGDDEARMAGMGVIASIPQANGIVGDLGGGSLELARVVDGEVRETSSFPLGVLRIDAVKAKGPRAFRDLVAKMLGKSGWTGKGAGLPFYMVGGSWRSLARLDMHLTGYPLPIVHHYWMPPENAQHLVRVLAHLDRKRLRDVVGLSGTRIPTLSHAALLLSHVVRQLGSSELIVSAYGLREGLLYDELSEYQRAQDPLIASTREEGARQGRFPEHGDLLDRWLAPLFASESPADARIRHATCLLADVGWRAHPEFRAERGVETALHGNWVGIDSRGRGMMAHALWTSFGGQGVVPMINGICSPSEIVAAERWGFALRLGQRFSGGVADALAGSRLLLAKDGLELHIERDNAILYGEAVERRHKALAASFGLQARLILG
ncbi:MULTISPECIES: Ppx/GppA family phosphatase [unclassified Sphingomonas]|uniref:Ppx/GppA family phosphatase n=1 Tax=unclassified Sphingomonas TaxID=196159 RepID=UPI0009E8BADE|nr:MULTISPECIES: Ppx/GppA family phosphatase [unclassified Sphingomonas]